MEYGQVAGVNKPISRLVQGTMMMSSKDLEYTFDLLDAVHELGCTAFDTAHVYGGGDNERTVGQWVNERGLRDKVVIIGKGAHPNQDRKRVTPFDIAADIHDSLARFKFDYIDLYMLHRDDPDMPVGPIVEALNEHMHDGHIHAFGGSNWTHQRIQEANAYAAEHGLVPFAASSPNYSLAEQVKEPWAGCITISGTQNAAAREWYAQHRFPLFAWSSLAGGFFSGRFTRDNLDSFDGYLDKLYVQTYGYPSNFERLDRVRILAEKKGLSLSQTALAYVLSQPLDIYSVVGCRTRAEFLANAAVVDNHLSMSEMKWLNLESPTL